MKRVTISSSLKFKDLIRETMDNFQKIGIEASFPNLDLGILEDNLTLKIMKEIEDQHFCSIDDSDALYVLNPNGYIGTLVTAEIGYALGKGKPIYYSEKANSLDLDALATGYIAPDAIVQFLDL
jgi:hypothetical protein